MISSSRKYAMWKLNIMSSSHTFPKYRSSTSTKWCIVSITFSSLSSFSTPATKYNEAYLHTLREHRSPLEYELVFAPFEEVAEATGSADYKSAYLQVLVGRYRTYLFKDALSFLESKGSVELVKASLAMTRDQQHEYEHF